MSDKIAFLLLKIEGCEMEGWYITIHELVAWLTAAALLGGWFHLAAIRPLTTSISTLKQAVDGLQQAVSASEKDRRDLDRRLADVTNSVKYLNKRITELREEVQHVGGSNGK